VGHELKLNSTVLPTTRAATVHVVLGGPYGPIVVLLVLSSSVVPPRRPARVLSLFTMLVCVADKLEDEGSDHGAICKHRVDHRRDVLVREQFANGTFAPLAPLPCSSTTPGVVLDDARCGPRRRPVWSSTVASSAQERRLSYILVARAVGQPRRGASQRVHHDGDRAAEDPRHENPGPPSPRPLPRRADEIASVDVVAVVAAVVFVTRENIGVAVGVMFELQPVLVYQPEGEAMPGPQSSAHAMPPSSSLAAACSAVVPSKPCQLTRTSATSAHLSFPSKLLPDLFWSWMCRSTTSTRWMLWPITA
jgi:hypothetical protein